MCGIAGLQITNPGLRPRLGEFLVPMLGMLAGRGPDSTGVAIYHDDAPPGAVKYSLRAPRDGYDWDGLARALQAASGDGAGSGTGPPEVRRRGRDAVLVTGLPPERIRDLLTSIDPQVRIFGHGAAIEVYKDTGSALDVCARYGVDRMAGYQGVGHTRMATESAVTTEHSHPFAVAPDLALVHNGSFSNYASIRRDLTGAGVRFDTDNDSEVAARYLAREMAAGADLAEALKRLMKVFDGFYTLLVASGSSLAVVRDSFACKPMVIAQTGDYVAVGSEYVALADLPGIEKAEVFEPAPEEIYKVARVTPSQLSSVELSCAELSVREINAALRQLPDGTAVRLAEARGQHNLAVGLSARLDITISGNAGYFTGGLGDGPDITVDGFTGWSAGENLMSGTLRVRGNASESAGSSAHGGLIVIEGDASSRAGISLKGGTVAVAGDVGHMSGFMAQAGTMLIGGDAGDSLGDSLYEAVIYVAGKIRSLGSDAQVEELTAADVARVRELAAAAGFGHIRAEDVTKVGSARTLYRFDALKDQRY